MSQPIKIGNFEFTLVDDEWVYKALPYAPLKRKVAEAPQIRVVEDIEKKYKASYDKALVESVKEIMRYLNQNAV